MTFGNDLIPASVVGHLICLRRDKDKKKELEIFFFDKRSSTNVLIDISMIRMMGYNIALVEREKRYTYIDSDQEEI